MSNGTSTGTIIDGAQFTLLKTFTLSKVAQSDDIKDLGVKPPNPKDSTDIVSITAYINKNRDFTFSKICTPLYGDSESLAQLTGLPANQPDFVADFHFIGIMRAIDTVLTHKYKGHLSGTYEDVSASS